MAKGSLIGWLHRPGYTAATWNVVMGCTKVSKGCDLCFAPRDVARQEHLPGRDGLTLTDWEGRRAWTGKVALLDERLDQPTRWRTPHMIFVTVLGDLFNAKVPEEFIAQVWEVMASTPQHIYIILTKQPKRMRDVVRRLADRFGVLPHVHLGVSAEDQEQANVRIPFLLDTPAAVRAVSCEPLLGPIDLGRTDKDALVDGGISWVIVGGESGRKDDVRPMHPDWARQLRDQATAAGVAFFFKQWGNWVPPSQMPGDTFMSWDVENGTSAYDHDQPWHVGKKRAGDQLDGRTWHQWPGGDGGIVDGVEQTVGEQDRRAAARAGGA